MAGIELSWSGSLARLRLAEPNNRNAFNLAFCQAFAARALDVAAAAPAAILIEAEGDAFSVGGDIAEFLAERGRIGRHGDLPAANAEQIGRDLGMIAVLAVKLRRDPLDEGLHGRQQVDEVRSVLGHRCLVVGRPSY